jgi:hypothetical protein
MPPRLPWLVRVLLRGSCSLPSGEYTVLDELERCLTWTLLNRPPGIRVVR